MLISETQEAQIADLEAKMLHFYQTVPDYTAFENTSHHPALWDRVIQHVRSWSATDPIRILEVGAGRSGFARYLQKHAPELRCRLHLGFQDVTAKNEDFLRDEGDSVFIGRVEAVEGEWHVVMHAYVLEHVVRPISFFESILRLLAPGGFHLFLSPRYDRVVYLPPALDHLSRGERWAIAYKAAFSNRGFWLLSDPAALHLPFQRDRDAVHPVSRRAIVHLHRDRARVTSFPLPSGSLKDYILKAFLTARMEIQKLPA